MRLVSSCYSLSTTVNFLQEYFPVTHISRQNYNSKRYLPPMFTAAVFTVSKKKKGTTYMSINRWMDKDVLCICSGILLGHKKNCVAIWSNMEEPRAYHTKWSKSKRERKIPYGIIYVWNLKYDTNELIYRTDSSHREQTCQGGVGKGWIESLGSADAN